MNTFGPTSGNNTITITFAAATARYLRLTFTANTGWPACQVSEFPVLDELTRSPARGDQLIGAAIASPIS